MEQSNNSDKLATAVFGSIFACLFTGGIAATVGFSLPVTIIATIVLIFALVYGSNEE